MLLRPKVASYFQFSGTATANHFLGAASTLLAVSSQEVCEEICQEVCEEICEEVCEEICEEVCEEVCEEDCEEVCEEAGWPVALENYVNCGTTQWT